MEIMSNYVLLQHKNQLCNKLLHYRVLKFTNFCAAFSLAFLYWIDLTGLSYQNHSHLHLILLKQEIAMTHPYILFEFYFGGICKHIMGI